MGALSLVQWICKGLGEQGACVLVYPVCHPRENDYRGVAREVGVASGREGGRGGEGEGGGGGGGERRGEG